MVTLLRRSASRTGSPAPDTTPAAPTLPSSSSRVPDPSPSAPTAWAPPSLAPASTEPVSTEPASAEPPTSESATPERAAPPASTTLPSRRSLRTRDTERVDGPGRPVLRALRRRPGRVLSAAQLAEELNLVPSTVTTALDDLARQRLVIVFTDRSRAVRYRAG